jgi:endonuclease/exonuclease/phosphatase family metal-dependent hydrolase
MTAAAPDALLHAVEYFEAPVLAPALAPDRLRIAAYNIERGLRLDTIIARWQQPPACFNDILLLSEVDRGMARSGNRHVARDFAAALGFSWAYALEFIELTKGNRLERRCLGENRHGHIGNAILSRFPLHHLQVVRLPVFFDHSKRFMARLGSRSALVADIDNGGQRITLASVHLESDSSPAQRALQMEALLQVIRQRDHGQPVVIAGDMNTTGLDVNRLLRSLLRRPRLALSSPSITLLERLEPMFTVLANGGYDYRRCNSDGYTLRDRGYRAHLDWFFVRNVVPQQLRNPLIYHEFENRKRYSDHLPIALELLLEKTRSAN